MTNENGDFLMKDTEKRGRKRKNTEKRGNERKGTEENGDERKGLCVAVGVTAPLK